jgi:hypothetical protein
MAISDFLVMGGEIIAINIARQLKRQFSDATVTVIEKEITMELRLAVGIAGCCMLGLII